MFKRKRQVQGNGCFVLVGFDILKDGGWSLGFADKEVISHPAWTQVSLFPDPNVPLFV
jgi:hypothetical protein